MKFVTVQELEGEKLEEQESHVLLRDPIKSLRKVSNEYQKYFEKIKLWMVNSTATGGGVAELLPRNINILRQLGIKCEWGVLQVENPEFFNITKRLHKSLQGFAEKKEESEFSDADRVTFEEVIKINAPTLLDQVQENDVVIIHDPQPLPLILALREKFGDKIICVWRFHIQFDDKDESSKAAWEFLRKYFEKFDLCVFSTKEYVPAELKEKSVVIPPGISSLGEKNIDLSLRAATQILVRAGICSTEGGDEQVEAPFEHQAKRFCPDGQWRVPADTHLGLLSHPVITQISRWDPLKGWPMLLKAFQKMKESAVEKSDEKEEEDRRRQIRASKLVLGGPDPSAVKDDPEGARVLEELKNLFLALPEELQNDVAIINFPMDSVAENALMVNATQRASSVIVQNSLKEGFGLTVSEAMWKTLPVVVSGYCPGLCAQVRDGIEGRHVLGPAHGPYDETKYFDELVKILSELIGDEQLRLKMGIAAQKRIQEVFLTYNPLSVWIAAVGKLVEKRENTAAHS
eukprot:TRINITY_DN9776_c0_g1_i1.p1 TRINITY_DN9776_c0_g1~~TRINITY_DN9776_c0_g1_i1.p1  ORF type:complete len:525 (+),score=165.36 TRINITY_DN9776_c0_g1_i1:25-1575(+)